MFEVEAYLIAVPMREGRVMWYTARAWRLELPTRHRRARGGGQVREVAMLGATCSSRGARAVQSSRWDGVYVPSARGALGVGVAPSKRSVAAVTSAKAKPSLLPRAPAVLNQSKKINFGHGALLVRVWRSVSVWMFTSGPRVMYEER